MAIWIANYHTPTVVDAWGAHAAIWYVREMLWVCKWTEDSNDGDAAWTSASNVLVNEPGGVMALMSM
jgi:hypothetical protein